MDCRTYTTVAQPKFNDLSEFCKEPEEDIDEAEKTVITLKLTPNNPEGLINYYAKQNNITNETTNVLIAISRLETGNWKSYAYEELNNFGGMSINEQPMAFDSKEDGCKAFVENLKENYIDEGLESVEQIASKYCPVNPEWADLVRELMNE